MPEKAPEVILPVKGVFIQTIRVTVNGQELSLSLWRNPATGHYTALETLNLYADRMYYVDPYNGQHVIVEDTLTGLPK